MTEEHTHYHGVDKAEEHLSVNDAVKLLLDTITPVKQEKIRVFDSYNRILFSDVNSPVDLPSRARSTRDGYAVSIDQNVAGQSFNIIGDVRIGTVPKLQVKRGEAVRVATGSYIPNGANAVVMVEYAQVEGKSLRVSKEIKMNENLLGRGEDLPKGELVLSRSSRISAQHVALFSLLGIRKIDVFSRPEIAFFSTGDELIDPLRSGKAGLYDATRPYIFSMISELGAVPVDLGIARDNFSQIKTKMRSGLRHDALILSAGSSVGERDFVSDAATSIDGVKILVHGVAMRPSSPTGIAFYRGKPLLLLPGFPTSAIISFLVFARPAILKLSGSSNVHPIMIKARLTEEYSGKLGLTHFVRVKVEKSSDGYSASIVRPTEAQYSGWIKSANGVAVVDDKGVARPNDFVDVFLIGEVSA